MEPREAVVASREVVELGLLAGPEDAQRQEAHEISEQMRAQWHECTPDRRLRRQRARSPNRLLCMRNRLRARNHDVETQESHRDGRDPITQRCKALHML